MWIIHLIAIGALLFGCLLAWLAHAEGQGMLVVVAWPIGLAVTAYAVSILAIGFAAGSNIREITGIVKALFSRAPRP